MTPFDLHKGLLRVRRAEELIAALYKQQEMRTPVHSSLGQEAVSVGVCAALTLPQDVVFASHRSHAPYLACGGSFEALAAELYGRETGCSRGRGGSVHLTSREHGFVASSAILGEMIAVATGAALAFKMNGEERVAVSFFGDAAMEEGIAYESFNFAVLNKLPVIFICENNGYSTESPLSKRFPEGTELTDRAVMFRVGALKCDGNDVAEVYETTQRAVRYAKQGQPMFIEAMTYRWLEHVGPYTDHEQGRTYRSLEEVQARQARDPILISADNLDAAEMREIAEYDVALQSELKESAERARNAPSPDKSTLFQNVW